mgnify:CR=1 FL=1
MTDQTYNKGFAIIYAVILTSVIMVTGLGLANIISRQIILGSAQKASQLAYYAANAGIECAYYMDIYYDRFGHKEGEVIASPEPAIVSLYDAVSGNSTEIPSGSLYCYGSKVEFEAPAVDYGQPTITAVFYLEGLDSASCSKVTVTKSATDDKTKVISEGYDSNCRAPSGRNVQRTRVISY